MVRLGEALGVDLPVTRAMVEVMGVMLQRDYWTEGLDLAASDSTGSTSTACAGSWRRDTGEASMRWR